MCRSIKQLRQPEAMPAEGDIQAAALQYVRKVSGYRVPSRANQAAFDTAVADVAAATALLIARLNGPGHVLNASSSGAEPVAHHGTE